MDFYTDEYDWATSVYDPGAYNEWSTSIDPADPTSGWGAVYDPGADNDSTISGWSDPQVSGGVFDPCSESYTTGGDLSYAPASDDYIYDPGTE